MQEVPCSCSLTLLSSTRGGCARDEPASTLRFSHWGSECMRDLASGAVGPLYEPEAGPEGAWSRLSLCSGHRSPGLMVAVLCAVSETLGDSDLFRIWYSGFEGFLCQPLLVLR